MAKKLLAIALTSALLAGNLTVKAEEVELTEPVVEQIVQEEVFEEITCPAATEYEMVEEEAITEETEETLPEEEFTEQVVEEEVELTEEEIALEAERLEQIAKEEAVQAEKEALALLREENPHLVQFISRSKYSLQSLLDEKPGLFRNCHFCVVDSVGNPKGTEFKFFNPDLSHLTTMRCAKDKTDTSRGAWTNAKVLRKTDRVYSANLKFDNKYIGYRDKAFGVLLEAVMGLRQTYNGTILVDEQYPLWNVTLKDREELVDFVSYLKTNLEKQEKAGFDIKPVLFLKLANDPNFATLTAEDLLTVDSLFELVDPSDEKVAKFFNDVLLKLDGILMKFESSSKTRKPGLGLRQQTMDKLEKLFSDFETKDATAKFASWGADKIVQGIIVGSVFAIAGEIARRRFKAWFGLVKPEPKPESTKP